MDIFWNYTLQDYEKTPFVCSIEEVLKILHFEAKSSTLKPFYAISLLTSFPME